MIDAREQIVELCSLTPINVSVELENGIPYLNYTGKGECNGYTVEINIPKMGLNFSKITATTENYYSMSHGFITSLNHQCYVTNKSEDDKGYFYTLKVTEREMTKAQIEKELGYKVKIVD
jgi:hypothetical protein